MLVNHDIVEIFFKPSFSLKIISRCLGLAVRAKSFGLRLGLLFKNFCSNL